MADSFIQDIPYSRPQVRIPEILLIRQNQYNETTEGRMLTASSPLSEN